MKQSDLNHLRRLLGWVRCDIGQDPAGQQQTMIHIAGKLDIDSIDADAKARLVEGYRRAEAVPVYVRDAVKALEKALAAAGRDPGVVAPRATAETRANAGFGPGAAAGRAPMLTDEQIRTLILEKIGNVTQALREDATDFARAIETAVLSKLRAPVAGEAVAWLKEDGSDAWTDQKKRNAAGHNGTPGARIAESYNVPLFRHAAPQAGAEAEIASYGLADGTRVERAAQMDGTYLWAVRRDGNCLGLDGHWSYEPLPSSRGDEWLALHRFPTAQAAIRALKQPRAGNDGGHLSSGNGPETRTDIGFSGGHLDADTVVLPPLPKPVEQIGFLAGRPQDLFDLEGLQSYARAAVLADRQQRYVNTPEADVDMDRQQRAAVPSASKSAAENADKILRERMAPISEALGLDVMIASAGNGVIQIFTFEGGPLVYTIGADGTAILRVSWNQPDAPDTLTADQVKIISQAASEIQPAPQPAGSPVSAGAQEGER